MPEKPSAANGPTLALGAVGVALGTVFFLLGRLPPLALRNYLPEVIALLLVGGLFYLAGVFLVVRFRLRRAAIVVVIAGSVVFRFFVLRLPPVFSDDIYRYQWEGRVQRAGLNPYTVYPEMPELEHLQDPAHPLETGRRTPTLYPPLSESSFTWPRTVAGYKRLYATVDIGCFAVLLLLLAARRQPLSRVLAYAWNPGVVVAFAGDGHHDSLAVLALLVAILLIINRKPLLSTAFLALAFLAKFFSLLLLPVFLRATRWRYSLVFLVVVGLGYVPYLDAGRHLLTGLFDFAAGWEGNDSLFRLIHMLQASKGQAYLVAGVLMLGLLAVVMKTRLEPLPASFVLVTGLLLLSPVAFPWYFAWMVPFLCFHPAPPVLLLSVTCVLGYSPVIAYVAGQPYRDSSLILALEYVPVYAWLAHEGWRRARRSVAAGSSPLGGEGRT